MKNDYNSYKVTWGMIRRSNFMISKFIFSWDQIHEIKFFVTFHEVKIPNNNLISWLQHFSWDQNSKKALLGNFDLMIDLLVTSKSWDINSKSIIRNFDLMIDLLVTSTIMRSKFKINYLNLVSCTYGKFLALIISHLCIKTFDLMIALAANKLIMRSKFPHNAFF